MVNDGLLCVFCCCCLLLVCPDAAESWQTAIPSVTCQIGNSTTLVFFREPKYRTDGSPDETTNNELTVVRTKRLIGLLLIRTFLVSNDKKRTDVTQKRRARRCARNILNTTDDDGLRLVVDKKYSRIGKKNTNGKRKNEGVWIVKAVIN
jgi:hypothetical protein